MVLSKFREENFGMVLIFFVCVSLRLVSFSFALIPSSMGNLNPNRTVSFLNLPS